MSTSIAVHQKALPASSLHMLRFGSVGKPGRPPLKFDSKQVQAFGRLGLTGVEMASLLGTTPETISHKMTDPESEFFKAYHLGNSELKKSLRHKQIAMALGGNVPLLIWLGRVHLGQHETPSTVISMTQNAGQTQPFPVTEADKERLARMGAEIMARARMHGNGEEPPGRSEAPGLPA